MVGKTLGHYKIGKRLGRGGMGGSGVAAGGSWNRDDIIIFADYFGSNTIMRVSAMGRNPSPVTRLNPARKEMGHCNPVFLPDGRHFLYKCDSATQDPGIYVGSLDSKPEEQGPREILAAKSWVTYAPSLPGAPRDIPAGNDRALFKLGGYTGW
jgi:hypothetical protein